MTLNPLHLLDSLLVDYASPKARRGIHTVILLALAIFALWQGAGGDWRETLAALAVLAYASANRANTAPPEGPDDNPEYPEETQGLPQWGEEGYLYRPGEIRPGGSDH